MEIFAFFGELLDQFPQLRQPTLGRADGKALVALWIRAWLAGIQPILDGPGEQTICDIPKIGLLVRIRDPIAQVHRLAEGLAERIV